MPTVMDAIVHAMMDFRKEMLDNLQLSLEYHTEQLEEIKVHMDHKINELEKRIEEIGKTVDVINIRSLFGGGWTVFQRRIDGSVDFYRNWTMYKHGFGDGNGEHWLGLENLHLMTKSGRHELLVLLEDFEGNSRYALYDEFKIGNEAEKYKLTVGSYSGTAGDKFSSHNGMKFSTMDQDNDLDGNSQKSCAETFTGAWWFKSCYYSHLNGQYYQKGNHLDKQGVHWNNFPRANYSLKSTTMMFRNRT
ncbi:AGAP012000-PA-like protein [Anopheles sinensis]|uniref:AGAP012000-PA-like protein n=1 Tax=Anopheles sinensis TaxID=74873 RepID=A0A084WF08_ANOSI|nr:AGAP012000-PA-like protein [Anopheles sinensis]